MKGYMNTKLVVALFVLVFIVLLGGRVNSVSKDGCLYLQSLYKGREVTHLYYDFSGVGSKPFSDFMSNREVVSRGEDGLVLFTYKLKSIPVERLEYLCDVLTSTFDRSVYSGKPISKEYCNNTK